MTKLIDNNLCFTFRKSDMSKFTNDDWLLALVLVAQLCPTFCDPMDSSGVAYQRAIHGSLQARILEWVDILLSRGSSQTRPGSPVLQADSLPSEPPGKPCEASFTESFWKVPLKQQGPHDVQNILWFMKSLFTQRGIPNTQQRTCL